MNTQERKPGDLIYDLLTENRFLTFWENDWSRKVYVQWDGKTPFKDVLKAVRKHLKTYNFGYERQVQIKEPELKFD